MGNKTKKINISNRIKKATWKDVDRKRDKLAYMGSKLSIMADKQSEKYRQLKNRYDEIEADVQEMISYLNGSYNAQKLIEAAKKAKAERDKVISRKGTKSKKLEEKLEMLELKREEEIQKIMELRGKINKITLLSEDEEYDEVSQKAEEWKIQNEMVKRSLNLRSINARIGMAKIRKSNQDAKDIENIKKVIDTYNERITEYKKEMDELNNKRPKSIPEEFMRENDWILGVVTIDKNKKIQEVINKIDEENREIREFGQERYFKKTQQEETKLPYKKLDDRERNKLIKYSEEMTTFKQLTEYLKIRAARAAGKIVGLTILAVRRIKARFKPKQETPEVVEETFTDKAIYALQEKINEVNLEKSTEKSAEEVIVEKSAEESMEKLDVEDNPKLADEVKVRKTEQSNEALKDSVNPFRLRMAVDNDVKKAIEAVPTIKREETNEIKKEIDVTTRE